MWKYAAAYQPTTGTGGIRLDFSGFLRHTGKRFFFSSEKVTKPVSDASWENLAASDALALGLKEVVSLGRRAYQVFALAGRVLFSVVTALLEQIRQQQNDFSVASVQLVDRLEQLRLLDLTSKELRQIAELLWVTAQIRRIGLYAGDVVASAEQLGGKKLSADGGKELQQYFQITLQLLDKALSIYEGRCFDQLRLLQQLEEQAEEQQMVLTDGYFQRTVDECYEPGTVFPNVAADCARCCELAGEIACVITGRDRL